MAFRYAGVRLADKIPYSLDREYSYIVPDEMRSVISRGAFVAVPFGNFGKMRLGIVCSLRENADVSEDRIKTVAGICRESERMDERLLDLALFVREQTLCTMCEAVRTMIPSPAVPVIREYFSAANDEAADVKDINEIEILRYIKEKGTVRRSDPAKKFGPHAGDILEKLAEKGSVKRIWLPEQRTEDERIRYYGLKAEAGEFPRSRAQKEIALCLANGMLEEHELLSKTGATKACIKKLTERNILYSEEKPAYAVGEKFADIKEDAYVLNEEQRAAYETLSAMMKKDEGSASLLYGVTGSGKTCVMIELIDEAVKTGGGVILLLPEIALTPQTLGIFCQRYGGRVVVMHSMLSEKKRLEAYKRVKNGFADIVIGTRSAVFAPVRNLKLLIIDEEQEETYKSDSNPKYHARDAARYRCVHEKALLLLCSATPSVESYKKAVEGKYTLLKLSKRYGGTELPEVELCDMRKELRDGNTGPLSVRLVEALKETISKGEQAVLFLNRRGYSNFIVCRSCNAVIKCRSCSVAMHYHISSNNVEDGFLVCHWCGRKMKKPAVCPECGSEHLVRIGFGTQRLETGMAELLPKARIIRMDSDSTSKKESYDRMIRDFREHRADILLGTQMVTKGHDFPDVTLVGVLLADSSLYADDYKSNERTFGLLTQVVGRAGRRRNRGTAIIQTNSPNSDIIKTACAQDYEGFYENEIVIRRELGFPPFLDIVVLMLSSPDEVLLSETAQDLKNYLSSRLADPYRDVPTIVFGPMEAPVYMVEKRYRMRFVIKCRICKRMRELLSELLVRYSSRKLPLLSVDINPSCL